MLFYEALKLEFWAKLTKLLLIVDPIFGYYTGNVFEWGGIKRRIVN